MEAFPRSTCPSNDLGEVEAALTAYAANRRERTSRVRLQARHDDVLFSGGMTSAQPPFGGPPELGRLYDYDAFAVGERATT